MGMAFDIISAELLGPLRMSPDRNVWDVIENNAFVKRKI